MQLSSSVTLPEYVRLEQEQDREAIANFVYQRFHERYIWPFENNRKKNGFIMMASSCLMIEALESFWQGWKKSPNSVEAFSNFFDRDDRFLSLQAFCKPFYKNVRCGIMHQGETTGGWRIRRDLTELFDSKSLTIDATHFLRALDGCVSDYRNKLKESEWNAEIWSHLRKKMDSVCTNAKPGA